MWGGKVEWVWGVSMGCGGVDARLGEWLDLLSLCHWCVCVCEQGGEGCDQHYAHVTPD